MRSEVKVNETFLSIQGESTHAGRPCFFIRFTGCNLRCSYCDTSYAWEEGNHYTVEALIEMAKATGVKLVEVTGGEPLLQEGAVALISALCDEGFEVLVETNGSRDISVVDRRATVVMDIKTPGSGMSEEMDLKNLSHLKPKDEVKFVITSEEDYLWAKAFVLEQDLQGPRTLFSPAWGLLGPETLAGWLLRDKLDVRLNLQLHKYIFGDRRGV
ncbi:MAG: radical SAM protein [Nitrospirae bacterium]|nr:MAG: radical SAM protein [Nitrospirota bacterium]